jgi:hypothetical protein
MNDPHDECAAINLAYATGAKQRRTGTLSSWRQLADINLIPPNDEDEFSIYGDTVVAKAAKRWALDGQYVLIKGVERCAHGLLGFNYCPAGVHRCNGEISDFDHVNVWTNTQGIPRPFMLMAPYLKVPSSELLMYAKCHGLLVEQLPEDNWYGKHTIPIRLSYDTSRTALGPLEEMLIVLNYVAPTRWPDEKDECTAARS